MKEGKGLRIPYTISRNAMQAQQNKMNTIAHNIANVNTIGFKESTVQFTELVHNAATEQDVRLSPDANQVSNGVGIRIGEAKQTHSQGSLVESSDPFHLSVGGAGFFGVRNGDNELMLTRDGAFHLNEQNQLVNDRGDYLDMTAFIPVEQWQKDQLAVDKTGEVTMVMNGQSVLVGQIPLYMPTDSGALTPAGSNMYRLAEGANLLNSAENPESFGQLLSGYTEGSNVDLAQSFTDMIMTQRAYSMNAKVVQSTDEIYSLINQFN